MSVAFNRDKNEVLIYGDFGMDVTAKAFVEELKVFDGEDVTVRINSPGGSVWDGIAIYNALKNRDGHTTTVVDGIAFSMASGVLMAGDTVQMASNGLVMLHAPSAMAMGNSDDMTRTAKMLDATHVSLAKAYADKSGLTTETINDMMAAETWLSADEAQDLGFVDEVIGAQKIAASVTLPESIKVPADKLSALLSVCNFHTSEEKREIEIMPSDTTKHEPEAQVSAATLDQLLALNGADNDFAVAQMKARATLEQAQNALNASLMERLSAANEDRDKAIELAKQLEEKKTTSDGHDPIQNDGETPGDSWSDPKDEFDRLFADEFQKTKNTQRAYINVHRSNPGLVAAVRQCAEAGRK